MKEIKKRDSNEELEYTCIARKVSESICLTIPYQICARLGIDRGDLFKMKVVNYKLQITHLNNII